MRFRTNKGKKCSTELQKCNTFPRDIRKKCAKIIREIWTANVCDCVMFLCKALLYIFH